MTGPPVARRHPSKEALRATPPDPVARRHAPNETPHAAPGRVGIVLVSHSQELAETTAAMAVGLLGGSVAAEVAPAGGAGGGRLGTDAASIVAAARAVDGGAGVAVLADVGSAVLTVKALLAEGDGLPGQTVLADAPFVEGALAALATAAAGADLAAVVAAAEDAYNYRKR